MTAAEIRRAITSGELTCEAVTRTALERVELREPEIAAWQYVDPDAALQRARALDRTPPFGVLHGVPVGIKDIIDTADMPTEYGSTIHAGARPARDAVCVALLRRAGAIILGKTVTTEFANFTPGKTRNPLDPTRTPGGSSSGSAAAVADDMIPLALGSQTTASTIRPASYCGIYGYRPTYGEFSCAGMLESSHSLDTIGLFARTLDDVLLLRSALLGADAPAPEPPTRAPRIALCRTPFWSRVDQPTRTAIERAAAQLSAAGAEVGELTLPAMFDEFDEVHKWISSFEFVRSLADEIDHHWDTISAQLRDGRIADGRSCTLERYRGALAQAARARATLAELAAPYDVLLTAAATGEAPARLDTTGDPSQCYIWTTMYVPALALPCFCGPNGMPIGLQVIGKHHRDEELFTHARWIEEQLPVASPTLTA